MKILEYIKSFFVRSKNKITPDTFEDAVLVVINEFAELDICDPYFHFTTGRLVRNRLGLWNQNNPLVQHMVERFGVCHADDLGSLITKAAHAKNNDLLYDPMNDVQRFKEHWQSLGYDPATLKRI